MGLWGSYYMGDPGKWPSIFPYHSEDENNVDEDSVASILGKINHKGCSVSVFAAGQIPCKSRLWAWGDVWLFTTDLTFWRQRLSEAGKKIAVSIVSPRCVWLMPPHPTRRKRLRSCAALFSAHLHPCSSCFTLLVKGWGKKVARNRKKDAGWSNLAIFHLASSCPSLISCSASWAWVFYSINTPSLWQNSMSYTLLQPSPLSRSTRNTIHGLQHL